jgi:hypothetical protein
LRLPGSDLEVAFCDLKMIALQSTKIIPSRKILPRGRREVVANCDHLRLWSWTCGGAMTKRAKKATATEARTGGALVPIERVERSILILRGEKVILDSDLADLYGVTTKRLNEQVRRNRGRFPQDFMFQLTAKEKEEVVANCDHLARLKYSPVRPLAFTEHGALMAANVLSSPRAITASVMVVRAFVRLRQLLATHVELKRKLDDLEKKYDAQFQQVFVAIRALMAPLNQPVKGRIGFQPDPTPGPARSKAPRARRRSQA